MKKLALAIVAGLSLGACATMDNGNGASASAAAGTQYCWQNRLNAEGGKLGCNWAASKREACEAGQFTLVDAARYSKPRKATLCANGQWLVEVAPAS